MDILNDDSMLGSKLVSTPSNYTTKLHQHLRTLLSTEDASSFGRLMGRLIYLTNTRLNITYVVQHLSQFVVTPILAHQQVAFRIHRYLKGTPGAGIFLFAASNIHLKGFSDPNWVGCIDNRRFLTDYVVYIVDSLIS